MTATGLAAAQPRGIPATRPDTAASYDAARGVLTLIVMLDHNDIVRNVASVNAWFLPMTFHVAGFLLLPFLVPRKTFSLAYLQDHAVRYLTPFFFALVGYSLAFHVVMRPEEPALAAAADTASAFVEADPASLQAATGFIVLWFLPALLSLVLLLCIYNAARLPIRAAILAASLVAHVTLGACSGPAKAAVPQGWLIALYVFPLGLLLRRLAPSLVRAKSAPGLAALCCVAVAACWLFERGSEVEVATLVLPAYDHPLRVLRTDMSDVCFTLALIILSRYLGAVPGLALIGRHSLIVYLVHPLLYKVMFAAMLPVWHQRQLDGPASLLFYLSGAATSVLLAACGSLLVALGIDAWPAGRRLVLPRGVRDWRFAAAGREPAIAAAMTVANERAPIREGGRSN